MNATNSFPDICEFTARVDLADCGTEGSVVVDLRLTNAEIPLGDHECEVGFARITISVDLEGAIAKPGSRFGEPNKSNVVTREVSSKENVCSEGSVKTNLEVGSNSKPNMAIGAGASKTKKKSKQTEIQESQQHFRVRAKPNLRWEVAELEGNPLDGTYLEEDSLLTVNMSDSANRKFLSLHVKVRQRDLQINQVIRNESAISFFQNLSKTQQRLFDIFIAKSLSNSVQGSQRYIGEISLSKFEVEIED